MGSGSVKLVSSIVNVDGGPDERSASSGFVAGKDNAGDAALDLAGEVIGVFKLDKGSSSSSGPFVVLRGSGARVDGLRVCFELISTVGHKQRQATTTFQLQISQSLNTQVLLILILGLKLQKWLRPPLEVSGMLAAGQTSCSMPTATAAPCGAMIRGRLRLQYNSPPLMSRPQPMLVILLRHNL